MSLRYLAGFITASYNPLKVPNAPTITTVTPGNTQLTVAFTAPANVGGGAITSYIAIAQTSAGVVTSTTGSSSPITITGLSNGTAYTVQVLAINAFGPGPYSVGVSGTPAQPRRLYAWGRNGDGQLGQNNVIYRSSPVQIGALTTWSLVSAGDSFVIATRTDGTIWGVGANNSGQLGDSTVTSKSSPVQIGALTNWSLPNAGNTQSFAVKTDGTLWAWGNNGDGQLGQNNRVYRSSPVQIGADTNWSVISSGFNTAVAIKTTGTIWSWGRNNQGQLGQNDRVYRSSPVQIGASTDWSKVDVSVNGGVSVVAVKTGGTLWAWGDNSFGQLGQSDKVARSSPTQIGALTNWTNASVEGAIIAVKTDGTLWTWGRNDYGQLGQNSAAYRSSPTQIGALTTWLNVAAGAYHMIATQTNNTIWTWGRNNNGQLGQNISYATNTSSPVQVGALTTWANVSGGRFFSYAITAG